MTDLFHFADDLGPAKILHVHEHSTGLKAILVVDNVACGPSIGGIRMAPDVSVEECFRLARSMTLKNAAADLPHGGGKSVVFADPRLPIADKERLIRALAYALRDVTDYIPGPDMGTDERCMAWIKDEIGRAVGLPPEMGGIPLDTIGATGFGVSVAAEEAERFSNLRLDGARVAIQGFGAVGKHAARFLGKKGAVLVAASDSRGTVTDPNGLDVARLIELKDEDRSVVDFQHGEKRGPDAIIDVPCDIWIPAARPDVIHMDNVGRLNTKLVVQGANIPITHEAEDELHRRNVLVIPDFIANAGGVICASVEYHGGTQTMALETIEEKIRTNTAEVLERSAEAGTPPRQAAVAMAKARLRTAMEYRRWK